MRITGLGTSYLDIESIVNGLILVERKPILRMQQEKVFLETTSAMWKEITDLTTSLQEALSPFLQENIFQSRTASSSDSTIVTAEASDGAAVGSHEVVVRQLAQAHRVASDQQASAGTALGLAGSPTINGVAVEITADMTLLEIRDTLNGAGAGVKAWVVDNTLLMESEQTGYANSISVVDDNNVLARLGVVANHALDAVVTASSEYSSSYPSSSITDGYTHSDQWGSGGGWNDATANTYPDTVDISFSAVQTVDQVRIHTLDSTTYPASQYGIRDFNLYYRATDTGTWVLLKSVSGNTGGVVTVNLDTPVNAKQLRVEVTATNGAGDYSRIIEVEAYNTQAFFKNQLQAAQDAEFDFDGLALTRSSNTFSDVIEGVTYTLEGESPTLDDGTLKTATVTVDPDTSGIRNKIEDFVDAYNDLYRRLNQLTAKGSEFQGEPSLIRVQDQVRRLVTGYVDVSPGYVYDQLALIGIRAKGGQDVASEEQGILEINSTELSEALEQDLAGVEALFSATETVYGFDGIVTRLDAVLTGLVGSDGLLPGRIDRLGDQIENVQEEIAEAEQRLEEKEEELYLKFAQLERSLSMLNYQQSWLSAQIASLPRVGFSLF